jgi:hypothetical protein
MTHLKQLLLIFFRCIGAFLIAAAIHQYLSFFKIIIHSGNLLTDSCSSGKGYYCSFLQLANWIVVCLLASLGYALWAYDKKNKIKPKNADLFK